MSCFIKVNISSDNYKYSLPVFAIIKEIIKEIILLKKLIFKHNRWLANLFSILNDSMILDHVVVKTLLQSQKHTMGKS